MYLHLELSNIFVCLYTIALPVLYFKYFSLSSTPLVSDLSIITSLPKYVNGVPDASLLIALIL